MFCDVYFCTDLCKLGAVWNNSHIARSGRNDTDSFATLDESE